MGNFKLVLFHLTGSQISVNSEIVVISAKLKEAISKRKDTVEEKIIDFYFNIVNEACD